MRRISVASNAIQTIDNEMANLHYLLFKLHSTRLKCDVYKTDLTNISYSCFKK